VTANGLCYTMGNNTHGQLGIGEPYVEQKYSPVLVDTLLNFKPQSISCGKAHTLVATRVGDCFAWGLNENGQCGVGDVSIVFTPRSVNFDQYYRANIRQVSAGTFHSTFVDDIGRLFVCGRGEKGQLGIGTVNDELVPYYITRIPDKVTETAAGVEHTLVLTQKGEIYAMGSNRKGQLGTGAPSKGCLLPTFLEELSFSRMVKVRAGSFSAALSADGCLYVWGEGTFGNFYTPHRIKSAKTLDIADF
jgi:alpha-tubulin suppressor-like RCC1 family protein